MSTILNIKKGKNLAKIVLPDITHNIFLTPRFYYANLGISQKHKAKLNF